MTNTANLDPTTLSFSQANGYEKLPQPLALEEVSPDARRQLWDLLWGAWLRNESLRIGGEVRQPGLDIFQHSHTEFWKNPLDTFPATGLALRNFYRPRILSDLSFAQLFDLWQIIMRHPNCPPEFVQRTAAIFHKCQLAYIVDTSGPPTILPAATQQEGRTLTDALRQLKEGGYSGAQTHLQEAGVLINAGEWADSVRESIHGVESVARQLDPGGGKSFGDAMNALEDRARIHPALRRAFGGLYGYTSDEQGIRHAILDMPESPVGRDEAVFMLGACASFVTYLLSKHRGP